METIQIPLAVLLHELIDMQRNLADRNDQQELILFSASFLRNKFCIIEDENKTQTLLWENRFSCRRILPSKALLNDMNFCFKTLVEEQGKNAKA